MNTQKSTNKKLAGLDLRARIVVSELSMLTLSLGLSKDIPEDVVEHVKDIEVKALAVLEYVKTLTDVD